MPGPNNNNGGFQYGLPPTVTTKAQWTWSIPSSGSASQYPTVLNYHGSPTKSGLTAEDLEAFIGVPAVIYPPNGGQPIPVPPNVLTRWIRQAEDQIELETSILLCQTMVAAPPAQTAQAAQSIGVIPQNGAPIQQLGVDYDIVDQSYDFFFSRAEDSGWMAEQIRFRPVKGPGPNDPSGLKNYAFIYPLLNSYYRVDPSWFVLDSDFGLLRLVPNTNIQMLPLFALQLTFQGFAQNVPGGIWLQHCAGLTPSDYSGQYSFMTQLILATAAVKVLPILQGSINFGVTSLDTSVDGLAQKVMYDKNGAYAGLIATFEDMREGLMKTAKNKVGGVVWRTLGE